MITVHTLRAVGLSEALIAQVLAEEKRESERTRKSRSRAAPKLRQKSAPSPVPDTVRQPTAEILPFAGRGVIASAIPEDWTPDSTGLMKADQAGLSGARLELELYRFRNYYLSVGTTRANWNKAWLVWLTNLRPERADDRRAKHNAAWADALAQLRAAAGVEDGGSAVEPIPTQARG